MRLMAVFDDVHGLHDLRHGDHERVIAGRFQAQLFGGLLGAGQQLVVVEVEAGQRPDHVGVPLVLGVLGGGVRHAELVGDRR